MKIFRNPLKEMGGWEALLTEEEIVEMEKSGYDVTAIRQKREAKLEKELASEADYLEKRKATAVAIDLSKLSSYAETPRNTETEFFKDVAGKAPLFGLFGKDKWKEKVANATLVYGAVVQANSDLWLPGNNYYYPAVFVFALDKEHMYDVEWLNEVAKKIVDMKESKQVPVDCNEFINVLSDDQSQFCFPLGSSLVGNAEAWCVTYKFEKQSVLPGSRLPEDGIVPFLLDEKPKKQMPIKLRTIPAKYYQA